jgi:hypothetical protein
MYQMGIVILEPWLFNYIFFIVSKSLIAWHIWNHDQC